MRAPEEKDKQKTRRVGLVTSYTNSMLLFWSHAFQSSFRRLDGAIAGMFATPYLERIIGLISLEQERRRETRTSAGRFSLNRQWLPIDRCEQRAAAQKQTLGGALMAQRARQEGIRTRGTSAELCVSRHSGILTRQTRRVSILTADVICQPPRPLSAPAYPAP